MLRKLFGVLGAMLVLMAGAVGPTAAEEPTAIYRGSSRAVKFDVSPALRSMTPLPVTKPARNIVEMEPDHRGPLGPQSIDPIVQSESLRGRGEIPAPSISFDGPSNVAGFAPPDPVGDVGPDHYVVMSNVHFAVYDKTGTLLYGPAANNTLWSGFGGTCESSNDGDPIVLHDQAADRWILTQFTNAGSPYYNCVAISQTADPTGPYYRYAFTTGSNFPDYPKYGVWPDAYYISTREFDDTSFVGVGAYAINRAEMIAGDPTPQIISFLVTATSAGGAYNLGDGLLPADLDGTEPPPNGSPNFFMGSMDDGGGYGAPADALTLWKFHVDFTTPADSSFTLGATIPIAPFDTQFSPCIGRDCIPQPATTNKLDILSYRQRPMNRLAYRNFGTHESLVTNQSVEATGGIAGMRWWEIRDPGGTPVVHQEGTFAPGVSDGIHRWMGSAAMDEAGNIALGYSASDATNTYPSVWYSGRLEGDPLGTLPRGEGSFKNGTGSQTESQRWGDYTSMNIDPVDDCTFWYVNQYLPLTSPKGWNLRIGAFRFDQCGTVDFYMEASPNLRRTCAGDDADFQISVGSVNSFANPVALAASGNPAGTTSGVVPSPVTPPGASTLTIGNTGGLAFGSYVFSVNGTATDSPGHSIDVGLDIFDMTPATPTPSLPADGALDQPLRPGFQWSAADQAMSYTIEIDDDPTFASPEISVSGISDTNYTPNTDLLSSATHYWRVSADNVCGTGMSSAVFSLTTEALPGDCGEGTVPAFPFREDFESGGSLWTHEGTNDTWELSSTHVHGGAFAYWGQNQSAASDQRLISPEIALPASTPLTLLFWNYQEMEAASATSCFDGSLLEISTDSGANWTQLPSAVMQTDSYNGPISSAFGNPLGGMKGWCGDPQEWMRSVVDLDAFAGQAVMFRFRVGTDSFTGHEGWIIDDVAVQACVPEGVTPLFADGFESGDTSAWSSGQ